MPEPPPSEPFFLIVTDHDRGAFSVEGPMTNDGPWNNAARHARDHLPIGSPQLPKVSPFAWVPESFWIKLFHILPALLVTASDAPSD